MLRCGIHHADPCAPRDGPVFKERFARNVSTARSLPRDRQTFHNPVRPDAVAPPNWRITRPTRKNRKGAP